MVPWGTTPIWGWDTGVVVFYILRTQLHPQLRLFHIFVPHRASVSLFLPALAILPRAMGLWGRPGVSAKDLSPPLPWDPHLGKPTPTSFSLEALGLLFICTEKGLFFNKEGFYFPVAGECEASAVPCPDTERWADTHGDGDTTCACLSPLLQAWGCRKRGGQSGYPVLAPFPQAPGTIHLPLRPAAGHPLGRARQGGSQGLAWHGGTAGTAWGTCRGGWPCLRHCC